MSRLLQFLDKCWLRMALMAGLHERIMPEYARFDAVTDTWLIHGIRYSGDLFRFMAATPDGRWFRIMSRDRDTLTIEVKQGEAE